MVVQSSVYVVLEAASFPFLPHIFSCTTLELRSKAIYKNNFLEEKKREKVRLIGFEQAFR
ncbi:hypothetical protein HanOQP8_Chr13g0502321 [Helianthus annuus]|nr:hypothetical protein HanOQP8_Chr13g0502321 [Helianthus annuus]